MSVRVRFPSGAQGAVFKDCPILQKPDNKHFAFIRLYFMLFGFVKNCGHLDIWGDGRASLMTIRPKFLPQ